MVKDNKSNLKKKERRRRRKKKKKERKRFDSTTLYIVNAGGSLQWTDTDILWHIMSTGVDRCIFSQKEMYQKHIIKIWGKKYF